MSNSASNVVVYAPRRTGGAAAAMVHLNPIALAGNLCRRRELTAQFTVREIQGRYKGSYLGLFWSMANPLLMLSVYTFVFHFIFKSNWTSSPNEPVTVYAMNLYSGMIAFGIFSESATKAPTLITSNPNYVKKVVFPLEILPVSLIGSAIFHAALSLVILLAVALVSGSGIHWTIVFLPIVILPMLLATAGVCWLLAGLGVFIRDTTHVVAVLVQLLFFVTPICYPMSKLKSSPALYHLMQFNPFAVVVQNVRMVVNDGEPPDWLNLSAMTAVCLVIAIAGYAWFMNLKRAFADVI